MRNVDITADACTVQAELALSGKPVSTEHASFNGKPVGSNNDAGRIGASTAVRISRFAPTRAPTSRNSPWAEKPCEHNRLASTTRLSAFKTTEPGLLSRVPRRSSWPRIRVPTKLVSPEMWQDRNTRLPSISLKRAAKPGRLHSTNSTVRTRVHVSSGLWVNKQPEICIGTLSSAPDKSKTPVMRTPAKRSAAAFPATDAPAPIRSARIVPARIVRSSPHSAVSIEALTPTSSPLKSIASPRPNASHRHRSGRDNSSAITILEDPPSPPRRQPLQQGTRTSQACPVPYSYTTHSCC